MTRSIVIATAAALALASASSAAQPAHMLTGARAGDPAILGGEWLGANLEKLGLDLSDVDDLIVTDRYVSEGSGITHLWLQQTVGGIPIENALLGVHVMPDGRILTVGDRFERQVQSRLGSAGVALSPGAAVDEAARHLGLGLLNKSGIVEIERLGGPQVQARFAGGALSARVIPVDLVWVAEPEGGPIRLAWRVQIDRQQIEARWPVVYVDATDGRELQRADLVAHGGAPTASYRVYGFPLESPGHPGATHSIATDPWDVVASPFGWHDTNGAAGFEFSDTQGNNVIAQDDLDANNSGGSRPSGGAGDNLTFDFAHNDSIDPVSGGTNLSAAIVNLFYWNNIVHDVLHRVGFNEAAGNFQTNNYGQGGLGNDAVRADALDGAGLGEPNRNNANFGTPGDGSAPRMQMFLWTAGAELVTNPGGATFEAATASFGALVDESVGVTAEMVVADPLELCTAPVNSVAGKVVLASRGTCSFETKVDLAETAGAVGVVIFNNVAGPPIPMGPASPSPVVAIPAIMVSQADGGTLQAAIGGGTVNGTIIGTAAHRDSDFDAGIIAHEYGHGWSNRLTGGPAAAGCLQNAEQAGEGWSDFLGLVTTMGSAASCSAPRGVGTYPSFEQPDGPGIRRFPYTRDMNVNPFTYDDTNDTVNQSAPHGTGSVWATAVWDMTCDLVDEYGFGDLSSTATGNGLALRLVSDGLKLQPCSPGMIDARNAILAADVALTGGTNECLIWSAFARRGFGFSASQGLSTSRTDQVEAFDLPPTACAIFADGFEVGDTTAWSATVP